MSTAEKIGMGFITIALVTTVILPGRQSVPVIGAIGGVFNGALKTSMGR